MSGREDIDIDGAVDGKIELPQHVVTVAPRGSGQCAGAGEVGGGVRRGDRHGDGGRRGQHQCDGVGRGGHLGSARENCRRCVLPGACRRHVAPEATRSGWKRADGEAPVVGRGGRTEPDRWRHSCGTRSAASRRSDSAWRSRPSHFPGAGRDDDGRGDETWAVIDVVADVTSHARRGSSEWLTGREVL